MLGGYVSKLLKGTTPLTRMPVRGWRARMDEYLEVKPLKERLEAEAKASNKFAEEKKPVDIGFPANRLARSEEKALKEAHQLYLKENPDLEAKSRKLQLTIDEDKVRQDWTDYEGQFQIKSIASHYGIYEHMFGHAYFLPRITLDIQYDVGDDEYAPVYFGNTLKPTHAKNAPVVKFDATKKLVDGQSDGDTLWTLVLTNPDGHFSEEDKEYVHWFVGNIPNGDVSSGEVIVPYLQPFPARGTGYHRHVFVLYKQDKKIDFSQYEVAKLNDLQKRTFKTYDFYREHQDSITPAGLAFFQSDWDTNLTEFYHNVLEIKEPVFEYDFPKPYHPPEIMFAIKKPFNLYLDRYRDPKEINKEFLVRELAKTDPFDGPKKPLRFPAAVQLKNIPQWLITEKKKTRINQGRVNEIREEYR